MANDSDTLDVKPPKQPYRRKRSQRKSRAPFVPLEIRVGNRQAKGSYVYIQVTNGSVEEADRFERMIDEAVRSNPRDPIIIAINGYEPWLEDVLGACINDRWGELPSLNRELQFSDTVKFPERSNKRKKGNMPWSFIVDEMNIPEVYYWTFDQSPPGYEYTSNVDNCRFRIAAWTCSKGAYFPDARVSVTILFTQSVEFAESVVRDLLFPYLVNDEEYSLRRGDEEGVCWIFLRLYSLLTDWQNLVREIERELDEAEINSRHRNSPVKLRTRAMHRQVDRIYELKEYLHFHTRSFNKLIKLKDALPKHADRDTSNPLWDEMADTVDDLGQFDYYMDSLKERFNNLIELEFNIENASQSDYSQFLSVIAALYLPISYLASVFGITTIDVPAIWYLWIAVPLLIISLGFTFALPQLLKKYQAYRYPVEQRYIRPQPQSYTMLGDELPDSADVPDNVASKAHDRSMSQRSAIGSDGSPPPHASSRARSKSAAQSRNMSYRNNDEKV